MAIIVAHPEFVFGHSGGVVAADVTDLVKDLQVVGMHQLAETCQIHRRHLAFVIAENLPPFTTNCQAVRCSVPFPGSDGGAFHDLGKLFLNLVAVLQRIGQFRIGSIKRNDLVTLAGNVDCHRDAAAVRGADIDPPDPAAIRQGNLVHETRLRVDA